MIDRSKANPTDSREALAELEKRCGLEKGFFGRLQAEETDWSFIIKVHAFLETAVTDSLLVEMDRKELEKIIPRLPLNGPSGKVKLARALKICSEADEDFISTLSSLRNRCVHQIRNLSIDLERYVRDLNPDEFSKFRKSIGVPEGLSFDFDGTVVSADQFIKDQTRFMVMREARRVLVNFSAHQASLIKSREIRKLARMAAKAEQESALVEYLRKHQVSGEDEGH